MRASRTFILVPAGIIGPMRSAMKNRASAADRRGRAEDERSGMKNSCVTPADLSTCTERCRLPFGIVWMAIRTTHAHGAVHFAVT